MFDQRRSPEFEQHVRRNAERARDFEDLELAQFQELRIGARKRQRLKVGVVFKDRRAARVFAAVSRCPRLLQPLECRVVKLALELENAGRPRAAAEQFRGVLLPSRSATLIASRASVSGHRCDPPNARTLITSSSGSGRCRGRRREAECRFVRREVAIDGEAARPIADQFARPAVDPVDPDSPPLSLQSASAVAASKPS